MSMLLLSLLCLPTLFLRLYSTLSLLLSSLLSCQWGCRYSSFVGGLEECSRDNLEFLKDKSLKAMFDLLRSKPEQVQAIGVYATHDCSVGIIKQVVFHQFY